MVSFPDAYPKRPPGMPARVTRPPELPGQNAHLSCPARMPAWVTHLICLLEMPAQVPRLLELLAQSPLLGCPFRTSTYGPRLRHSSEKPAQDIFLGYPSKISFQDACPEGLSMVSTPVARLSELPG